MTLLISSLNPKLFASSIKDSHKGGYQYSFLFVSEIGRFPKMIVKSRYFSSGPTRRLLSDILRDNSGTIVSLGVIGSGAFGIGLYLNESKVFEEKINAVRMEAKKDNLIAEEKIEKAKIEAEKEALQLLYHIFTQEEFKEAKKKILAQAGKN